MLAEFHCTNQENALWQKEAFQITSLPRRWWWLKQRTMSMLQPYTVEEEVPYVVKQNLCFVALC